MKFLHPILSWLTASALIFGDIIPSEAKGLLARILVEPFTEIICCVSQ